MFTYCGAGFFIDLLYSLAGYSLAYLLLSYGNSCRISGNYDLVGDVAVRVI